MALYYTDDAERDFARQDLENERRRARLPVCEGRRCGKRIAEDEYYDVHGEILCEECMKRKYRRYTDDLLDV